MIGVQTPREDTIVMSIIIANYDIKWVLVDNEVFRDMLFYDAFS